MYKEFTGGDWDLFGADIAPTMLKRSSGGVIVGADLLAFQKRAAVDFLRDIEGLCRSVRPGEVPVHLIAMGCTELFGANRNGDGFKRACLREYHPTFVKHARFYRDHKNDDPEASYGRVIKSAFNEAMGRVELLVGLSETKEAAERNGGRIATRELEKLARHEPLGVSMSCYVAYDVCSACGNRATKRAQYCRGPSEGGSCRGGGLMSKMGQLIELDGGLHHLHADNPHPKFFDISSVGRPADRIAYALGRLTKAASATTRGQEGLPLVQGDEDDRLVEAAAALKAAEDAMTPEFVATWLPAFHPALQKAAGLGLDPASLAAMHAAGICLPPRQFLIAIGVEPEQAEKTAAAMAPALPGLHRRPRLAMAAEFLPSRRPTEARLAKCAAMAGELSLGVPHVLRRCQLAGIQDLVSVPTIGGEVSPAHRELADGYAAYKTAFVAAHRDSADYWLTARLAVLQNYASTRA